MRAEGALALGDLAAWLGRRGRLNCQRATWAVVADMGVGWKISLSRKRLGNRFLLTGLPCGLVRISGRCSRIQALPK